MAQWQTLAVRTPLTPLEAIDAIWHAHQEVIGGPCPVPLLEILSAQSAFETARWKALWNFNFGNIRGTGPGGEWMSIHGAGEIDANGKEYFPPDGHENMFAAYRDRYAGAGGLVRFLGTASHPPAPNRYQRAWDAACAGDLAGFVRGIREQGYFTAGLERYTSGVRADLEWLRAGPMPEFLQHLELPEKLA